MRNTFLDIYDYVKINQKIKQLEEEKTEVDDKLLKYIVSKKPEKAKFIKARTIALKDARDVNDELNEARNTANFLSTCIRHPFKTSNIEYDSDINYDSFLENIEYSNSRRGIVDEIPQEKYEDYEDTRILFTN